MKARVRVMRRQLRGIYNILRANENDDEVAMSNEWNDASRSQEIFPRSLPSIPVPHNLFFIPPTTRRS